MSTLELISVVAVAGLLAACATPPGGALAPLPKGRCIKTPSTQRPNLKPTATSVPAVRNPARVCRPIEP